MLSYDNAAAIAAAPTTAPVDCALRQLIADRVHDWTVTDLLGLTHLVILEPSDTEDTLLREIAYTPLVNPADGKRFGRDDDYIPPFDYLQKHPGWFELIQTVANDGFAFCIFIRAGDVTHSPLGALCRAYADYPPEVGEV